MTAGLRIALTLLVAFVATTPGASQDEADEKKPQRKERLDSLPFIFELPRPSADVLLNDPPFDWMRVTDDRALVVEPVSPRPGYLKSIDERLATIEARRATLRRPEYERLRDKARDVRIRLRDDLTGFAYDLERSLIEEVIYHEDLCLEHAAKLREEQTLLPAWELLEHVRDRDPKWPGLEGETNRMMLADAAWLTANGQGERAIAVLETLRERDDQFEDLPSRYENACRSLALEAIRNENYRRARHFRRRLETAYPSAPAVRLIGDRLAGLAREQLRAAADANDPAVRSDAVRQAARIWPEDRSLPSAFRRLVDPYAVVHVGCLQLASPVPHPLLQTAATARHEELTTSDIFGPTAVDGDLVRYGSPYVERWQLVDLGRRAVVDLRPGASTAAEMSVDAFTMANAIRTAEDNAAVYGDRWQGLFRGVRPVSPGRLELTMENSPLRLDALLGRLPLPLRGDFARRTPIATPYQPQAAVESARYVAVAADRPEGQPAEIVEHRFETAEDFGRSLRRDELDAAVDVPAHLVGRLRDEQWFAEEVILSQAGLPRTHLIQFRPGSAASEEVMLRLGLARAIRREMILDDVFLTADDDPWGELPGEDYVRISDSPFPTASYATNPNVERRTEDRPAAVALGLLAKRRLGDRWQTFRLICPDVPELREAAGRLVGQWREAGYPVELVPADRSLTLLESGEWDMVYRSVAISEPTIELWPLLAMSDVARLDGIRTLPEPLRRRLIRLDRTDDWPSAVQSLHEIHRTLWEQAIVIPLWEIDRLLVRRRTIRDAPQQPVEPYQGVAEWTADPAITMRED